MIKQKITLNLWFDDQAEEAAKFYTSTFKKSKILNVSHYPKSAEEISGKKAGSVMTVEFELEGQKFLALNGGPIFKFNEAISLIVDCENQEEVDELWQKLTADGGEEGPCGWCKDKFGLSWQVVPKEFSEFMASADQKQLDRAMAAVLKMKKLDITKIMRAAEGK